MERAFAVAPLEVTEPLRVACPSEGCVVAIVQRRRGSFWVTIGVVTVLLAVAGVVAASWLGGSDRSDEADRVRQADRAQLDAVVNGDADALASVLAPDAQLITPDGSTLSGDDYIQAVSSGDLDYRQFVPISPVEVVVDGDLAVVTFESHLDVAVGGQHLEHDAWHTHVYEKQNDAWRMVWAQATAVGGFPPTP